MKQQDTAWLRRVLNSVGKPDGASLDCFGTPGDPDNFLYFTVHSDRLSVQLRRIAPDLASLCYEFVLSLSADAVCTQRIMRSVEGNNQRIRKQLGEAYSKAHIGLAFDDLTEDEKNWLDEALHEFDRCWVTPGIRSS